jgi:hypothetical protein
MRIRDCFDPGSEIRMIQDGKNSDPDPQHCLNMYGLTFELRLDRVGRLGKLD